MTACGASPVSMSCSTTREAWLEGIANPRPMLPLCSPLDPLMVAIAELTPITRPCSLTSGPPELPGLMAASVWIALR